MTTRSSSSLPCSAEKLLTDPQLRDDAVLPLLDGFGDDPACPEGDPHALALLRVAPNHFGGQPEVTQSGHSGEHPGEAQDSCMERLC